MGNASSEISAGERLLLQQLSEIFLHKVENIVLAEFPALGSAKFLLQVADLLRKQLPKVSEWLASERVQLFRALTPILGKYPQHLRDYADLEVLQEKYLVSGHLLGEGSTSKVFLAFDLTNGECRAIKRLNWAELTARFPEMRKVLDQEIKLLQDLNSQQIVKLHDWVQVNQKYLYLILEYVNGGTVGELLSRERAGLPEAAVQTIIGEVAEALQHLHERNILHRDLKPDNLLLVYKNQHHIKLADFTFARRVPEPNFLMQSYVGTPLYMAPEILAGSSYTEKADLWSLGVILYELLFGVKPFGEAQDLEELQQRIKVMELMVPKEISGACLDLLHRLLQRDYHARISWQEFFQHEFVNPVKAREREYQRLQMCLNEAQEQLKKEQDYVMKLQEKLVIEHENLAKDAEFILSQRAKFQEAERLLQAQLLQEKVEHQAMLTDLLQQNERERNNVSLQVQIRDQKIAEQAAALKEVRGQLAAALAAYEKLLQIKAKCNQ